MFENCHHPLEVAHIYRRLGFPIALHYGSLALITTPHQSAITMPPELAQRVWTTLRQLPQVPIITHTRPGQNWIFLVNARTTCTTTLELQATLHHHHVTTLTPGKRVWLPMSDARLGWYWVSKPKDPTTPLPTRTAVYHAVQHALDPATSSPTAW